MQLPVQEMNACTREEAVVGIDVGPCFKVRLKLSRRYLNAVNAQRYVIYIKMIKIERVHRSIAIVNGIFDEPYYDTLWQLSQDNIVNRFTVNSGMQNVVALQLHSRNRIFRCRFSERAFVFHEN